MKIVTIIFVSFCLYHIVKTIIDFIKSSIEHQKVMNMLSDWSKFHKKMMEWSDEIQDEKVKEKYLEYCISILISYTSNDGDYRKFPNIDEVRSYIFLNYKNHIPSIKKKIRQEKLDDILESKSFI